MVGYPLLVGVLLEQFAEPKAVWAFGGSGEGSHWSMIAFRERRGIVGSMKRDMDLIRKILLAVEEHEHGFAPRELVFDGYSDEQVSYHNYLICDAGLADGSDGTVMSSTSPEYSISHLTSAGHDFLDAAREPSRWKKAMGAVASAGGGITLSALQSLLTDYLKKQLGLDGQ